MRIEVEFWQLVTLLVAFFGACAGTGKLLLSQAQRHIDERFAAQEKTRSDNHDQVSKRLDSMETAYRLEAGQWKQVERDLLVLRSELPLNYVRREDYIRGQSVIEAKLDALGTKFENMNLRALVNGGNHAN